MFYISTYNDKYTYFLILTQAYMFCVYVYVWIYMLVNLSVLNIC